MDQVGTTAGDGTGIPIRTFEAAEEPKAAMIVSPAMGTPAAKYDRFADSLGHIGYHVMVAELRGVASSPVRPSRAVDFGYGELAEMDLPAVVAEVRLRWPDLPLVLVGHSLGGQVSLLYAAAHPHTVAALVLPATGTIHWRAYGRHGPRILLSTQLAMVLAAVIGVFPGRRLGFAGTEARTLIRDWAHTCRTGRWEPVRARFDYENLLPDSPIPTLSLTVEGDRFAPQSAALALVAPLTRVDRAHVAIAPTSNPHFGWLREPEPIVQEIHRWLSRILADWTPSDS